MPMLRDMEAAILAAMQNPTPFMVAEGQAAFIQSTALGADKARDVWLAMVQAAIDEAGGRKA